MSTELAQDPGEAEIVERGSRWAPVALSAGLLGLGGVLLWQALIIPGEVTDAAGPKLMPVVVAILWLILSTVYAASHLRDALAGRTADDVSRFDRVPQVVLIMATLIGYAFILQAVGYLIATTALVWTTSRVFGSRSWLRDLAVAVGLTVVVYFVFSRALGIYLPPGVLPL
ncbi:tripartite tricarboxylate transporter TctB family protein [Nocardioides sp. NBC_00850]|uniref:tripartite tricarboxylate transporter TctB family protein n=1 Tax=Nocardioides sp. NBC_00850 TaxID=2976001 RepID=UPI0038638B50|nr:tripartite tricarboxylate transporter TctB family protein [Nocardioides sp. NBC_00850]